MPYLTLLGKEWDFCSDMLPTYLFVPIQVLLCWAIPLATTTYKERTTECYGKPGHGYYRVAIISLFLIFVVQLGVMLLAFVSSLRGTPLETRKRWLAENAILALYGLCFVHLGFTIFGTYVLDHFSALPCPNDSALHSLVGSSWAAIALVVFWTLLCLKWFPNQAGTVEGWISRLRCLCTVCGCLGFKSALEPLRQMDADEHDDEEPVQSKRENALVSHLAETFHVIFGDLSFTHSDRHVALVLATALQQVRRRERIRACLLDNAPARATEATGEEKQQSRSLRRSITQKWPTIVTPSSYAAKVKPEMPADEAADLYTGISERVPLADLEEAIGYFEYAVAAYYVQDEGMVASEESKTAEKATAANREPATAEKQQKLPTGDTPPPQKDSLADATPPTYDQHPEPSPETTAPLRDPVGLIHAPEGGSNPSGQQGESPLPAKKSSSGKDELRPGAHISDPAPQGSPPAGGDAPPHKTAQGESATNDSTSGKSAAGEDKPSRGSREHAEAPHSTPVAGVELEASVTSNPVVDAFRSAAAALSSAVAGVVKGDPQPDTKAELEDAARVAGDIEMGLPSNAQAAQDGKRRSVDDTTEVGSHSTQPQTQQSGVEAQRQLKGRAAFTSAQTGARPTHASTGATAAKPNAAGGANPSARPPGQGSAKPLSREVGKSSRFPERKHEELLGSGRKTQHHHHHHAGKDPAAGQQSSLGKIAEGEPAKAASKEDGPGTKAGKGLKGVIEEGDKGKVESSRCTLCTCTSAPPEPTPLDALDCIYSRADNTILGTLPYMIALDWERKAVIVGVRGTSSMSDALTDAIAQPIPILPWLGDVVTEPDGRVAAVHSGILAAAAAVNHDLEDHGILGALLSGAAVDPKARARHIRQKPDPALNGAADVVGVLGDKGAKEGPKLMNEMSTTEEAVDEADAAEKDGETAEALMERDTEVMNQARLAKEAERRKHLESRRAASFRRRSPPRRRLSLARDVSRLSLDTRRAANQIDLGTAGSTGDDLEMQRASSVPHSSRQPPRSHGSTKASGTGATSGQRRSLSMRLRRHDVEAQQPELARDSLDGLSAGNVGNALRRIYSKARNALQREESPSASPRGGTHSPRKGRRLETMLQEVEDTYKKVFLSKIFSKEQDLRRLESAQRTEAQQRRRADARAKRLKQLEERKLDCRGWQLVLTGHSLGAGVAALLALKLRPRFPKVPIKCWAFCPPGGLVTPGLAHAMEPFCTSVVVGKDGVPRASLGNLSRLVDEVTVALARGRRCKTHVLLRNFTAKGRAKFRKPREFYDNDEIPQECREVLDAYLAGAEKRAETIGQAVYPPGKVIYCRRLKEARKDVSFDAVWAPPEDIINEGFIISSRMLKDHLCGSVSDALETAAQRLRKPSEKPSARIPGHDSSDEESETE